MEQLNNITELSELKKRVEMLENKILKPQLTDLQHIPLLYGWFEAIASEIQFKIEKRILELIQR